MSRRGRVPGAAAYADVRGPAYAAALLAFASAAVSLFWTLGGTSLLDTVGGALEDLARDRSAAAIAVGVAVTGLKAAAGLLALALNRPSGLPRRLLVGGNAIASLALILWGGINVVVGALVLGDVIVPEEDVDEHALRWHVFVWDLRFLVWGLFVALATARYRRHARKETPAPGP